jgi:type VI secretion system VasD/TssJ family lipoprotein
MIRAPLLWCGFVLSTAGCTGVTSIAVGLQPTAAMNPNHDKVPNPVRLKVLRLAGDEVAKAFEKADFDALWSEPIRDAQVVLTGPAETFDVQPGANRTEVRLDKVPPEVTHIGILALFNEPVTGKDRVLLRRDQADEQPVHLHGHMIDLVGPDAPVVPVPAAASAPKPGS